MRTSLFKAACLLSVAALSLAGPAWADDQIAPSGSGEGERSRIVVTGTLPVFTGNQTEEELDQRDVASYGVNTVGDLLGELGQEVDPFGDGAVFLINGHLVSSRDEVADIPTEAVQRVQLLSRDMSALVGQSPNRRVINVVLNENHRQATLNGELGRATVGEGWSYEGEANLLRLQQNDRTSLVLRARRIEPLFESDRPIVPDVLFAPYDLTGNITGTGGPGSEIDPLLSALAGKVVVTAAVPSNAVHPLLSDFAANANRVNFIDVAPFRSLVADSESYSANGQLTRHLGAARLSLSARAQLDMDRRMGGLFASPLGIPAGTPYSPFSRAVVIDRYIGDPLEYRTRSSTFAANGNILAPLGKWQFTGLLDWQHRNSRSLSDNGYDLSALQAAINAGLVNPFASIPQNLIALREGFGRSSSDNANAQAIFAGSLFELPAGAVQATFKANLRYDEQRSESLFQGTTTTRTYSRTETGAQAALSFPIIADSGDVRSGSVTLQLVGGWRKADGIDSQSDYGLSLDWHPLPPLSFRAAANWEDIAPSVQSLNDPVVVQENVRVFDFLTNQTPLVRYVTGGNPNLPLASRRTYLFSVNYSSQGRRSLTLSADYISRRLLNGLASLPPISAAVQAAFPDHYVRDASGTLILVDSRPIAFGLDDSQQVHWSATLRTNLGASSGQESTLSAGRRTRLTLSVDHLWTLSSRRQARPGLEVVDLLAGGAAGYGGGTPRHIVQASVVLGYRGMGADLKGSWRSESLVRASSSVASAGDLTFAPRTIVSARVFADLGVLFPNQAFLKNARVSLETNDLFDSSQRVRDLSGTTPLRYQRYLIEPLGRVVKISLRKAF
jgi:hypothetical protein